MTISSSLVGIGTTTPTKTLEVAGDISASGDGFVTNLSSSLIRAKNADGLKLQDYAGNLGLYVTSSGFVGVGTDNPVSLLHVEQGDIRIDSTNNGISFM